MHARNVIGAAESLLLLTYAKIVGTLLLVVHNVMLHNASDVVEGIRLMVLVPYA